MSHTEDKMKCMRSVRPICASIHVGCDTVSSILAVFSLSIGTTTTKDELVHHLSSSLYRHGEIYEIHFAEYSYYPMNLELLYAIPLYLGMNCSQVNPFCVCPFNSFAYFYFWVAGQTSVCAFRVAFIFLSHHSKLSHCFIDLVKSFFLCFPSPDHGWIKRVSGWNIGFFPGSFAGWPGTKYNGLITLAILALLVPIIYARYGKR